MKKYNVVVIGLGRIGFKNGFDKKRKQPASHIEAIKMNKRLVLTAVCDNLEKSRIVFQKKYKKNVKIFSNYNKLIEEINHEKLKCDILVIATSDNTHEEILTNIARNILKNKSMLVFCEKPISNDLKSAIRIRSKFRKYNLKLIINHSRRWSKVWNKAFVLSEKLGDINNSALYFSTSPENKSKNQLRDGIHIADIGNWFKLDNKFLIKRIDVDYFIYDFHLWGELGKIEILNNGKILKYYKSKISKNYQGFKELHLKKSFIFRESMLENSYNEFVNYLDGKIVNMSTDLDDAISSMRFFEKFVSDKNPIREMER